MPALFLVHELIPLRKGGLSPEFSAVQSAAPWGAVAAILGEHIGPTGYDSDFTGYDVLLFINLTNNYLANAAFGGDTTGLDPLFRQALLAGGTQVFWGGGGPATRAGLNSYAVYATLIASGDAFINASADGTNVLADVRLANGESAYLVQGNQNATPEPASLILCGGGLLALGLMRRKRVKGGTTSRGR